MKSQLLTLYHEADPRRCSHVRPPDDALRVYGLNEAFPNTSGIRTQAQKSLSGAATASVQLLGVPSG
jgi:hypothetical protein